MEKFNLKEFIRLSGKPQKYFAAEWGVDESYISNISTGRRNMSRQMAEKIANTFELPVDYVIGRDVYNGEDTRVGNPQELEAVELMRSLPKEHRQNLIKMMELYCEGITGKKAETEKRLQNS